MLCCAVLRLCAAGLAGAVSRTATAPVDRLKMLLQVQEGRRLSIREGMRLMQSEGEWPHHHTGTSCCYKQYMYAPVTVLAAAAVECAG